MLESNLNVMGLLHDMRRKDILKDLYSVYSCRSGWVEGGNGRWVKQDKGGWMGKWMVGKTYMKWKKRKMMQA